MKGYTLALLSALAPTAFAQGSVSGSSTSTAPAATSSSSSWSSLIPNTISQSCKTFLGGLDSNADISSCLSTLVSATSQFNPSSTAGYSQTALDTTLTTLCGATGKCDETKIRALLAGFYTACQTDLLGDASNDQVEKIYDILYVLLPLRDAVCSKDPDTTKYCVQEIHADATSSVGKALIADNSPSPGPYVSPGTLQLLDKNSLYESLDNPGVVKPRAVQPRADGNTTSPLVPDTKTWRATSLVYLFISPEHTAQQLCTSCTKAVLSAYVKFEAATPYALGLTNSPLLGDQLNLWNNLTAKCNTTFTSAILNSAGYDTSPNGGMMPGGASRIGVVASSIVTLVAGVTAFLAL